MKANLALTLAIALSGLICSGCRDAYDSQLELQTAYPDAAVVRVPGTETWAVRLPNGAVLFAEGTSTKDLKLQPVQFIAPLRADEFDPEYQPPTPLE